MGGRPSDTDEDEVVLVAPDGTPTGRCEKLAAHRPPGLRHLAFSVVVFASDGRTLLQRRAATKYHFPLYWTNACCSHPRPGEPLAEAAARRVREELGLVLELRRAGVFTYRAVDPVCGLVEHEVDHVFFATSDAEVDPDPDEVAEVRLVEVEPLLDRTSGLELTPWLRPALELAQAARERP